MEHIGLDKITIPQIRMDSVGIEKVGKLSHDDTHLAISDAFLMENNNTFLMEDDCYFRLEGNNK